VDGLWSVRRFLKVVVFMQKPAPTSRPVGVGFVGCGSVFEPYLALARELERRGLVLVRAACGRARQRSKVIDALCVPRFTEDYRELVAASDVDLVLVLTSPRDHGLIARAALEAGKHVLVEKPVATTLEEAAALVALAKRSPGHLVAAPFTILSPTFKTIARRIRRGDIGGVASARARYGWAGPGWSEWFYQEGGGALFDLGVYSVASLTGLLGSCRRVAAMTGVVIPEREVNGATVRVKAPDNAQILLEFGQATFAAVTTGFTIQQYQRGPGIELYGTAGTIHLLGDDWDPDGYEIWRNETGSWELFKETAPDWPWADGLPHLVESIRAGTRPLVTPEHAYHVLEILLAAEAAGRDGRSREIQSSFPPIALGEDAASVPAHLIHDRTRKE
jgi:predicted dehydrogenase